MSVRRSGLKSYSGLDSRHISYSAPNRPRCVFMESANLNFNPESKPKSWVRWHKSLLPENHYRNNFKSVRVAKIMNEEYVSIINVSHALLRQVAWWWYLFTRLTKRGPHPFLGNILLLFRNTLKTDLCNYTLAMRNVLKLFWL